MIISNVAINVFLFCVSALCASVVILAVSFLVDVIHSIRKDKRK